MPRVASRNLNILLLYCGVDRVRTLSQMMYQRVAERGKGEEPKKNRPKKEEVGGLGESPSTQQLTKCRAVENGRRGGMVNEDMVVFGSNIRAQSIRTSRCHGRYIARKEEGGGRKGEHRGRCLLTRDTQAPAMTPLPHATVHAARTRRVVRKAGRRGRRARVAGPCVATPERLHDTSPPRNSTGCADKRCRGWNVCQLLICARTNCVRTSAHTSQGSLPAR